MGRPAGNLTRWIFPFGLLIWGDCWVKISPRSKQQALSDWGNRMQWTAPAFEEVCLNCEINSYVSAKL
jgi:coenzyme PQQ precursor peptide PqqA